MTQRNRIICSAVAVCLCVMMCKQNLVAEPGSSIDKLSTSTEHTSTSSYVSSIVNIDPAFGDMQCIVDAQIYEGMRDVCSGTNMRSVYGNQSTPLFKYACEVINPCFAFATSKGEAGGNTTEPGVSLCTVIATNNKYYSEDVDWVYVTQNLSQVDEMWYMTHCDNNVQTLTSYKSCYMPISYLQNGGSDELGIGPYQITTENWVDYTLEKRMSPTMGWTASMQKAGTSWFKCGIDPISDITVFALLSMSHQGGGIINSDVGKNIANAINTEEVQDALRTAAWKMYVDLLRSAQVGNKIGADNMHVSKYVLSVYENSGIDFTQWTYGHSRTNTGNYVITHTLQYMFYKYYFGIEEYST